METVSLIAAIGLIALAAVHILEEAFLGFRRFLNTKWFNGTEDCPVGRLKGLLVDQIGLFVVIAALALAGAWIDGRLIFVPIGIITADLVQHGLFSLRKNAYTPGVATSALYLLFVLYFFTAVAPQGWSGQGVAWLALAFGAAGIGFNYWRAASIVKSGRCQEASA